MARRTAASILLAVILAFGPSFVRPSLGQAAPSSGPSSQLQATNQTDVQALYALRNSLSLTSTQTSQLRWDGRADPCGNSTCTMSSCNWNGIACRNWNVVALDISPAIVSAEPTLLGGSLPADLGNMTQLQYLNTSFHSIRGTLPAAWGGMTGLQTLDVSNNGLNGSLPSEWNGMSSVQTLNLSMNALRGAVPQNWEQLTNLQILNVSGNQICQPASLAAPALLVNDNATSCSSRLLADSPIAAPAASFAVAPPPPQPPSPSATPSPPTTATGVTNAPILQMSTGINIAVSVVIGAFLLFGIVAGAFRVRRQQAAHNAWLRARADAMRRQEREDESAFQQYLKRLVPPMLAVGPDGEEICLAVPLNNKSGNDGDGGPPGPSGTGGSGGGMPRNTAASAGAQQQERGAAPAAAGPSGEQELIDDWFHRIRYVPRTRKLPLFVINAHFTPGGAISFGPVETSSEGPAHVAVDIPQEASATQTSAPSLRASGLQGIWNNLRGGREASTEGAQPQSVASNPASRAASAATLGTQLTDPSVAARVRERIEQLQEGRQDEEEGPAPPAPMISWAPLRRLLRMENLEQRDSRLRAEATEAVRAPSRTQSTTARQ